MKTSLRLLAISLATTVLVALAGVGTANAAVPASVSGAALVALEPGQAMASDYGADGVRIRTTPGGGVVMGLGYRGDRASVFCYKRGQTVGNTSIWFWHINTRTGVSGFSLSTYFNNFMDLYAVLYPDEPCPF